MKAEQLTQIIRNTTWLKLSDLERVCGLPSSTLQKVKNGTQSLPQKHVAAVLKELKKLKNVQ